jgi:two-component system, chemotaxis family, protein-glutamate methylesterase/glutaminase
LRDIVVIGGSAGSIEALRILVHDLPADFPAAIFVAVHRSSDSPSLLDIHLSRWGSLPASQPTDGDPIGRSRIYVARPDHQMTIEGDRIRVLRGPRENRHSPAIDPLFRTAAREYGPRVIGVILSGLFDDGSAGLYAVKERGGFAIVQEPEDAIWDEMPRRAIAYAKPQSILRTEDIAPHLIELINAAQVQTDMPNKHTSKTSGKSNGSNRPTKPDEKAKTVQPKEEKKNEPHVLAQPEENLEASYPEESEGVPSVFACPECHGVLWELRDKELVRFRCRVGHTYGPDSLTKELSAASERALWAAMRALEEKASLQRRVADGMGGNKVSAKRLRDQSDADYANARLIRAMIFRRDEKLEAEEEAKAAGRKIA